MYLHRFWAAAMAAAQAVPLGTWPKGAPRYRTHCLNAKSGTAVGQGSNPNIIERPKQPPPPREEA